MTTDPLHYVIFQIEGALFPFALLPMFALMLLLWPKDLVPRLCFAFIASLWIAVARNGLAAIWPEMLGARYSWAGSIINGIALVITLLTGVVAWVAYVRDGRSGQ